MTALQSTVEPAHEASEARGRRFGGVLWRASRRTKRLTLPFAGTRWNPVFAIVEHRGRRSGRLYRAPVAARRVANGFVISLAFGAQVDWNRNLAAAGGGTIRWQDLDYPVTAPETLDAEKGMAAFHPIQRLFLRVAGIDGYVHVRDAGSSPV